MSIAETGKYPTHNVMANILDGVASGLGDLQISGYVRDAAAAIRDLGDRLDAAMELVQCQDKLLAAYRLGKHPGDKLLDRIAELRKKV